MKNAEPHWVVIYIAHSQERADGATELLTREGFVWRLNPISRAASPSEACFEVMTLSCEAQEARDILYQSNL